MSSRKASNKRAFTWFKALSNKYVLVALLLSLSFIEGVFCGELRINNAADLVDFSKAVNSGTSYPGTTVFLESDIAFTEELSQQFEPIGKDDSNYFRETFDGQGHTISNLSIKSLSQYVGLFGYSDRATIRNVVMDSSYSATSSYKSTSGSYVGGVIGDCYGSNGQCVIENTINMGSVFFSGNMSRSVLYLGGIAGYLYYLNYDARLKNCANYGAVAHEGASGASRIGGIVGYSHGGSLSQMISIQNCLNYGAITDNNAKSSDQHIGGIAGYTRFTAIENCVSAGKTSSSNPSNFIGGIVGKIEYSQVSHCYWDKDVNESACGFKDSSTISGSSSFDSTSFELSENVSVGSYTGTSLLEALNTAADHYYLRDYSHWALNRNSNTVTFTINGRTNTVTLDSQIILLPSLASEGLLWFDRWYTDASCESPLSSFEITSDKELYGKWGENTNSYTITFDTRGGTAIEPITAQFGNAVSLPRDAERDNCVVGLWENDYGDAVSMSFTVPAHNLTLHVVWSCTVIRSAADLVEFSKVVNYGISNFDGTAVFLESDIVFTDELSQQFEPIGKEASKYFRGTFDGQGYTISNLSIKSLSQYVGLFGYSTGTTIRNVVMDSTYSATSSYKSTSGSSYVGGVIGDCEASNGQCVIENTVNMGSVYFSGNTNSDLNLGGIVGYLSSSSSEHNARLKNCANYGAVAHEGASGATYVGGIVGYSYGRSLSQMISIQNCLNYGAITDNNAKTNDQYLGGIAGYTRSTAIENCVSARKIASRHSPNIAHIGGIAGNVNPATNITHCLWTSDVGSDDANGTGSPEIAGSSLIVAPNITTIGELNSYAKRNSWNKWVLNTNNVSVAFRVGGYRGFALDSQMILLPDFADNNERTFSGWFWDEALSFPFTGMEVYSETTLYGMFCRSSYTVTLDVNGGDALESRTMAAVCNETYGGLLTPTRTGHSFAGWFTEMSGGVKVETGDRVRNFNDHTLYAHWTVNNYTVTFVFCNGKSDEKRVFPFNTSIEYPDNPRKEGHSFNGWDNYTARMPAHDLTIQAQWNISNYTVLFDFSNGTVDERVFVYNTPIEYPEDIVEREGHSFSWDNIIDFMPARDLTVTLQWTVNNYTVIFIFNNGEDDEKRSFAFNSLIEYPDNPRKEGYTFIGWNNYTATMPARDITVVAQWSEGSKNDKGPLSTSVIVGIIILVIVVIVVVPVVLFIVLRMKSNSSDYDKKVELSEPLVSDRNEPREECCRFVVASNEETENFVAEENITSVLSGLYPPDYARPTMSEALLAAGLTEEYVEIVCYSCGSAARNVVGREDLPEGFTEEDAAAVALYTYEFGTRNFERNPYRIINRSLVNGSHSSLQQAMGLLYLVMSALRKLPRVTGRTLYRGVRGKVDLSDGYYRKGNVVTWPALSSTSPDMETTKKFLSKGTTNGCAAGTLFIIDDGWGYNIRPYSLFPTETEILLEPERRFKVTGILQAEGLTFINLQMLKTPLSIPEVFGYGKK